MIMWYLHYNYFVVPININSIPIQTSCIPVGNPDVVGFNVNMFGLNSTVNNCRIVVCNIAVGSAVDLQLLHYGAFGIVTSLDGTVAGLAS